MNDWEPKKEKQNIEQFIANTVILEFIDNSLLLVSVNSLELILALFSGRTNLYYKNYYY